MTWPTMSDYQETIQNPTTCFFDHELKNGTPVLNNLGLPKPIAGGFACVYQMICGSHNYAVRCFLTKQLDLEKRYKIISDYLRQINLPYMVSFEFIAQGIRVNGQWFPILKMEWINGEPLNIYLGKNLHQPQKLEALANNFTNLIEDLRKYSIAHGDLQHENILVANEQLILIDYDGLYIPALEAIPSNEFGHRNYQHPSRSEKDYGPNLDYFSAWVIYTSILALCVEPNLWDQFKAGDGSLIFRKEDFLDPNQSSAFKLFEQSTLVPLQSFAKQIRILLSFNDLSKIPIININSFSETTNSQSISPQGLPTWLQGNVDVIKTTISNNCLATRSEGSSILYEICIGLSTTIGLVFKKRFKNPNNINNELQNYILEDSSVLGIGPQLISALNKAGITTAADILDIHIVRNNGNSTKEVALIEVSGRGKIHIEGIGPVKARALLDWKNFSQAKLKKPMLRQTLQRNTIKSKYEQQRNLLKKKMKLMLELIKWLK